MRQYPGRNGLALCHGTDDHRYMLGRICVGLWSVRIFDIWVGEKDLLRLEIRDGRAKVEIVVKLA